jgi:hypothetical protein
VESSAREGHLSRNEEVCSGPRKFRREEFGLVRKWGSSTPIQVHLIGCPLPDAVKNPACSFDQHDYDRFAEKYAELIG